MTERVAFQMEFAGHSDVGRARSRNEDSFAINREAGLALVCDGMGGHAGGDIASRTSIETIVDFIYEYEPQEDGDDEDEVDGGEDGKRKIEFNPGDDATVNNFDRKEPSTDNTPIPSVGRSIATIRAAIMLANRRLISLNQQRGFPEGRGMGTTVVGLWLVAASDKIVIFHAGDSRLYRLRNGELRQLTRDHSLYQNWLDNGAHGQQPHRNIIMRALGIMPDLEPEVSLQAIAIGDVYLICSDGLTGMASDQEISDLLRQDGDLQTTCKNLIDRANERGGNDNVTVVLARCIPAS